MPYRLNDPHVKKFIKFVTEECKKYGVKLMIRDTTYVWCDGSRVSGFFSEDPLELVVAKKSGRFLEVLAHEYCHLTQLLDKKSVYHTNQTYDHRKFDTWLTGGTVHNINEIIDEIREIELDNEKRTVKIIRKHKLPIDIAQYIRESNSYVLFYEHIKYTRRWSSPYNRPYKNPTLVKNCPDRFIRNYPKYYEKIRHIFEEEGI